jgi:hypothetical protein
VQATTLLIVERGAHWIERALAWRTRANEAVVALIQDRAESARAFRGRVERRIRGLRRKGFWVEQILLLCQPRRTGRPEGGWMLAAVRKALAASTRPVQVLLVPRAPGLVATVSWERPLSVGEGRAVLHFAP